MTKQELWEVYVTIRNKKDDELTEQEWIIREAVEKELL